MANILRVTTPPTSYDNNVKNNPLTPNDKQIQNPIDPSKVVRPDGKNDSGSNQDMQMLLNSQSNFGNFVQTIRDIPQLTQMFSMLFFEDMANMVEAGIGPEAAKEIEQFLEMMKMTETDLTAYIKDQVDSSVRYKGPFFTLLRQLMSDTQSVELKAGILEFLKKYNDMASGPHILKNMENNLNDIVKYMYRSYKEELQGMIGRLDYNAAQGMTKENAALLKEEIVPFLKAYITNTHDLGKIRDIIGVLTFNVARYENGSLDNLMQSLQRLTGFPLFKQKFNGLNEENLLSILKSTDFEKVTQRNQNMMNRFVDIMRMGVSGEAGYDNKQVFHNLMQAILLNESVYMPVLHLMLPIELNGNTMFSEMWIDPDDSSSGGGAREQNIKLLIKFDIKNLGFFDMIMLYGKEKIDLQIHYPQELSEREGEMKMGLTKIMKDNGLNVQSMALYRAAEPIAISEVFPKIYERKNAVNVTI